MRVEMSMKKPLKRRLAAFPILWVAPQPQPLAKLEVVVVDKKVVGNRPLKLPLHSLLRPQVENYVLRFFPVPRLVKSFKLGDFCLQIPRAD